MNHLTVLQIAAQAHQPLFVWGPPGVGKTANVEAIARGLGVPAWTVILSTREPTDQAGLPIITEKGVRMHPPLWAAECAEKGGGIVFFDEFNTAPATVQSSALRVIQDGVVGDLKLPSKTSFIACGNPPSTSTGVYQLTAATANRWLHLDWQDDADQWFSGMLGGWPTPSIVRLPAGWEEKIGEKRSLVVSFLRVRPELRRAQPESREDQGKAWPSPRTWDMTARMLAAAAAAGHDEKSEIGRLMILGCVGQAAMVEFTKWIVTLDLRDPEEYLADPLNTPLPKRSDQVFVTLDAVAAAACSKSPRFSEDQRLSRFRAAFKLVGRVIDDIGSDVAIPSIRSLVANGPSEMWNSPPAELSKIKEALVRQGVDFRHSR